MFVLMLIFHIFHFKSCLFILFLILNLVYLFYFQKCGGVEAFLMSVYNLVS